MLFEVYVKHHRMMDLIIERITWCFVQASFS
jgi:hypothetical protein